LFYCVISFKKENIIIISIVLQISNFITCKINLPYMTYFVGLFPQRFPLKKGLKSGLVLHASAIYASKTVIIIICNSQVTQVSHHLFRQGSLEPCPIQFFQSLEDPIPFPVRSGCNYNIVLFLCKGTICFGCLSACVLEPIL